MGSAPPARPRPRDRTGARDRGAARPNLRPAPDRRSASPRPPAVPWRGPRRRASCASGGEQGSAQTLAIAVSRAAIQLFRRSGWLTRKGAMPSPVALPMPSVRRRSGSSRAARFAAKNGGHVFRPDRRRRRGSARRPASPRGTGHPSGHAPPPRRDRAAPNLPEPLDRPWCASGNPPRRFAPGRADAPPRGETRRDPRGRPERLARERTSSRSLTRPASCFGTLPARRSISAASGSPVHQGEGRVPGLRDHAVRAQVIGQVMGESDEAVALPLPLYAIRRHGPRRSRPPPIPCAQPASRHASARAEARA